MAKYAEGNDMQFTCHDQRINSSHFGWLQVLHVLCGVAEYDEMALRHNEDKINTTLSGEVRWPTDSRTADDPHTKANLLLQVSH